MPTKVQFVYNEDYSQEAMYIDGRLVEADEKISAEMAVEHIAYSNITIQGVPALVVKGDYDAEVFAMQGFPDYIDEIPEEALLD